MTSRYLDNEWNAIREHYARWKDEILSSHAHIYGIDPYEWDMGCGMINMTPIEYAIWCDIRNTGIVMYPQWPQCGFFLDFANPVAKVAIECDGREFHEPRKDQERDRILGEHGWTVYRIRGRDCNLDGEEDEDGNYQASPGEKLCRMIGEKHLIGGRWITKD